jgi:hypothetical protein
LHAFPGKKIKLRNRIRKRAAFETAYFKDRRGDGVPDDKIVFSRQEAGLLESEIRFSLVDKIDDVPARPGVLPGGD